MDFADAVELGDVDAVGQAALAAAGEVTAAELLEAALLRLDAGRNLNAVITDLFDRGQAQAADLDASGVLRSGAAGPLAGVPFLLKDLGASLAGAPEAMGSRALRTHVAAETAWIVERYLDAGLVIFGKTTTPEFALAASTETSLTGATRNPWDLSRSAGGSSGGSAAAVAAGIVPAAHASDGGGSIRIPASCCGLFGMKPTRARTPSGPQAGEGWGSLAAAHVLTRSVRDSAALLDATQGAAPGDPYHAPPRTRPYTEEVATDPGRLRVAADDARAGFEQGARHHGGARLTHVVRFRFEGQS